MTSLFTGWVQCLYSCLVPREASQGNRTEERGVEREMTACHTQPHLVPPMKLVVYDDLPSPTIPEQHRHSLSSWINEGRHLASRASTRASMSMKRQSTPLKTPLQISAPSDFRRVQSFQPPPSTKYRPLDLRIHRSGNRLSDLPSFESFQVKDGYRKTLPAPPRALTVSTGVRDRRCQTTVVVSRKPVGSKKRRSLGNLEPLLAEQPVRITSALIPHFSTVTPVEISFKEAQASSPIHNRSISEGNSLTLNKLWPSQGDNSQAWGRPPQTPTASKEVSTESVETSPSKYSPTSKDSPSTASSRTTPSQISSLRRPSLFFPETKPKIPEYPSLSNRVTQWMHPTSTEATPSPKQTFAPNKPDFSWERTRTLSGTTVASATTTITGGDAKARNNSSISSVFSNAITPRTSFQGPLPTTEKGLEVELCHPTILENQRQDLPFAAYHEDEDTRYRETGIGLAF
ncbi:hypothetical protein PENANT_c019G06504 [Penicillium antarcticum]|uniref:Uncharacterized protein n=1 Tax=Penicillium antarcticum TaxID=416450 RepID=A0A1V6Q1N9_9EURO|nr:uncharacterized protein N7508_001138 [Penicillium antarcticum]KAJ5316630.1 hypothetical protein N7508_001138 [Penicillium antarcticum]OQD82967.1 hypothetical protein PENANT_c019G06504 [Penicillium antarcticum]